MSDEMRCPRHHPEIDTRPDSVRGHRWAPDSRNTNSHVQTRSVPKHMTMHVHTETVSFPYQNSPALHANSDR
eukprot:619950-Rhodomonas_salina.1